MLVFGCRANQAAPQQELTGYSRLAILFPAEQGTMHTNTGAFDVQVALQPTLNAGDTLVVTLDGTACDAGATTATVDLIDVQGSSGDDVLTVDLAGGPFAPGAETGR